MDLVISPRKSDPINLVPMTEVKVHSAFICQRTVNQQRLLIVKKYSIIKRENDVQIISYLDPKLQQSKDNFLI
jgi:hypothetical protein